MNLFTSSLMSYIRNVTGKDALRTNEASKRNVAKSDCLPLKGFEL